jgi:hypothetical protein
MQATPYFQSNSTTTQQIAIGLEIQLLMELGLSSAFTGMSDEAGFHGRNTQKYFWRLIKSFQKRVPEFTFWRLF